MRKEQQKNKFLLLYLTDLLYNSNKIKPKGENKLKKVLFVASEAVPFIKTGGLADVVGSLPKYFNKDEFDVRVIIAKYK